MAVTKIRGTTQIMEGTIENAQIGSTAEIALSKLANGTHIMLDNSATLQADLDANSNKITNVANGTNDGDVVNYAQLQQVVTQGKAWKEVIFHQDQLFSGLSGGIASAQVMKLSANLQSGDTITLHDGTSSEDFVAGTDFTIGADINATLANLASAINGGAIAISAVTGALDSIEAVNDVIVIIQDTIGQPTRVYGNAGAAARATFADPTLDNVYEATSEMIAIPTSDPAATNFGLYREFANLVANETHLSREDDSSYTWDSDGNLWNQTGATSIPYASKSIYGKVMIQNGLNVATGIISVDAATNDGIAVDGDGVHVDYDNLTIGIVSNKLAVKADGIGSSHVDWGTGADQISQDDVVDGATYKQYDPTLVAITGGTIDGVSLGQSSVITALDLDYLTLDGDTVGTIDNHNLNLTPNGTGVVKTDNLAFDGNTISTTNVNGSLTLSPNGTGAVLTDNLSLNGNTLTTTNVNGNLVLVANGTGSVDIDRVDIDTGTIDGVSIGSNTVATFVGVDNLSLDGNAIASTNGNGNIQLAPNGTGNVDITKRVTIGTSGTPITGLPNNSNVIGLYVQDTLGGDYFDGISISLSTATGDGNGALRPVQASATASSGANLAELYGGSFYSIQEVGADVKSNSYAVMGWNQINETDEADTPDGYIAGLMGIYDTPGVDPQVALGTPGAKAAVLGVIKDNANTKPHAAFMAFMEGDSTGTPVGAAFKAVSVRSTAGGGYNYGLDLFEEAGLWNSINTADIRLSNGETVKGITAGEVEISGKLKFGELQVDNININGNTISSTDTNGVINLSPAGTGDVNITKVDIASGEIDNVTIGTNTPATEAQIDNININGNTISSTNANGNIQLDPHGTGLIDVLSTMQIGTTGANYSVTTGANVFGIYATDTVGTGYTDAFSAVLKSTGGDGNGGMRAYQGAAYASAGANLGELYGGSFYAIQEDGSQLGLNLYGVMGYAEIEETNEADTPDGYITGVLGIYDTNGVDPTVSMLNPGFKAGIGAVVKQNANSKPHAGVMSFLEGDNGTVVTDIAAFKAAVARTTVGAGFKYGLDLYTEAGMGATVVGSDIRLTSGGMIGGPTGHFNINSTGQVSGASIKDEDDMASNSAVHLASQQSIKAYADTKISRTLTQGWMLIGGAGNLSQAVRLVTREVPNEVPNDVRVAFTVDYTPLSNTECVYKNGLLQEPGAGKDYTISGTTVTFASAPKTGDTILINYLATT